MTLFISTLTIVLTVAIANIIAQLIPQISNAYVNILMGMILALFPITNHLVPNFDNDVFMIVVLAPLLFFEGQRTTVVMVRDRLVSILGTAGLLAFSIGFCHRYNHHYAQPDRSGATARPHYRGH
ncbi:hypothetical protein ACRYI5_09175 [Furfurilactobacillus sp. WILCCON 0119]